MDPLGERMDIREGRKHHILPNILQFKVKYSNSQVKHVTCHNGVYTRLLTQHVSSALSLLLTQSFGVCSYLNIYEPFMLTHSYYIALR